MCVYNCGLLNFHYYVTSFVFYQKQNLGAFIIISDVAAKAVSFESWPEINGYGDKVYNNCHSLDVPKDDIECKSFTVISIGCLLIYDNKYYLQVY